jgi:glycosyltransferase involved in cell wall biosynthesis
MADKDPERPRACVVIPTYNEADNIGRLLEAICSLDSRGDTHVVVVDDASADGTGRRVQECAEKLGAIELLARPAKLGLGTAYIAGFRRAFALGATFVATMDADFSHAPENIEELIEAIEVHNADLAIGSRYISGGRTSNWGLHRKVLSRTANTLAHRLLRLRARDCTSGFRCYRVAFLRSLDLDAIVTDGYSFLVELLYLCEGRGARVVEVPIVFRNREHGKSKISKAEIFKAVATLWRLLRTKP